jgi:L-fuconolactonase
VLELVSTYGEWLRLAQRLVPDEMHDAVFGGTARRFYRLDVKVAA